VTVHTNAGEAVNYRVVTWLSREKAVAIAVAAHLRRYSDDQPSTRARDVEVTDLGPAGRAADGTVAVDRDELIDRMEF